MRQFPWVRVKNKDETSTFEPRWTKSTLFNSAQVFRSKLKTLLSRRSNLDQSLPLTSLAPVSSLGLSHRSRVTVSSPAWSFGLCPDTDFHPSAISIVPPYPL